MKRTAGGDGSGSPLSPQRNEKGFFSTKKGRKKHSKKKRREGNDDGGKTNGKSKSSGHVSTHLYGRRSSFPSLPILKLVQQIENYKNELRDYLDQSGFASHTLGLLHSVLPPVIKSVDNAASLGCNQARKTMVDLHQEDKKVEYTDSLMVSLVSLCQLFTMDLCHISDLSPITKLVYIDVLSSRRLCALATTNDTTAAGPRCVPRLCNTLRGLKACSDMSELVVVSDRLYINLN